MVAPTVEENAPRCALRCEPVFNLEQQRAATHVELVPLNSSAGKSNAGQLTPIFRHLHDSGIEQMMGKEPVILHIPAAETKSILDIPWETKRLVYYLDVAGDPDQDVAAAHNKILDKGVDCALDISLREKLQPGKTAPRAITTTFAERDQGGGDRASNTTLWLQRVDTRTDFKTLASEHAAQWISGDFWKKPDMQPGRAIPASRLGAMRLLAELQDPNISIEEVEKVINCDTTLSYKLLKLLNSAFFSSPGRVDSIRNGVNFFGLQRIKNWATVIVMNSVEFKPREILPLGAYRARLAEMLAHALGHNHPQDYYLVGLFSVLDAMFDSPMRELITPLHLQSEVLDALAEGAGPMGEILSWIRAIEEGKSFASPSLSNMATIDVLQTQLDALTWTNEFCQSIRS